MTVQIGIDAQGRADVKAAIELAKHKPPEQQVAFNEGVMCAAFALGAYIDGSRGLSADATTILERAFRAMTGMKIKIPLADLRDDGRGPQEERP